MVLERESFRAVIFGEPFKRFGFEGDLMGVRCSPLSTDTMESRRGFRCLGGGLPARESDRRERLYRPMSSSSDISNNGWSSLQRLEVGVGGNKQRTRTTEGDAQASCDFEACNAFASSGTAR